MATRGLIIICDLDGIVVDLLTPWLAWANQEFGTAATLADIRDWNMHENPVFKPFGTRVYDFLDKPGVFEDAPPLPGADTSARKYCSGG